MKYHDKRGAKPSRGPAGARWGRTAAAGVLACTLAFGAGAALVLGGATTARAEESDLAVTIVGSSSTTTDLIDGGTYDLSHYNGSSKTQILKIKNAGTYHFVQSGTATPANVQIKVGASSSSKVIIWLDGVTIDNTNRNLSAVSIEGDSNVEIHSTNGSKSTLIGGAEDADSDDGGAGVYVNHDATAMFASDANIVAQGGCFTLNGQVKGLRAAGIGGAGSGHSDSGALVFEDGCTIEATDAQGIGDSSYDKYMNGGAGIGSGFDGVSGKIVIYGGTITATGGPNAAGIGSGSKSGSGNGGNVQADINILSGTITATGGTNAAGIGSGNDGDLDASITISGGTVTASAGTDAAAIGTGASGTLKENRGVSITAGTVKASGGSVGMGFGASGSADKGSFLKISGGTVYVDSVSKDSDFRITIVGGLVPSNLGDGIYNESGQSVYWMELPVPDPTAVVTYMTSNSGFSAGNVQPDSNGYVYVYLPSASQMSDENRVSVVQNGTMYEYHDKRTETGDIKNPGYLKMDSPEVGIHADPLVAGGTAMVYLEDSDPLLVEDPRGPYYSRMPWVYTSTGDVKVDWYTTLSPYSQAQISAAADATGAFTVHAEMDKDTKGYWAHTGGATYQGVIQARPDLAIADLTKPYDGAAITPDSARSQVTTNSDGQLTVTLDQLVDGSWKGVASATDVGHYRVTATVAQTDSFGAWSTSQEFDILKAATATNVSASRNSDGATVSGWTLTAQVGGFLPGEAGGTVTFVNTTNGLSNVLGSAPVDASGKAIFTLPGDGVTPGTYQVTATYEGSSNYASSEGTLTGFSDLSARTVTGDASRRVTYEKGQTFSLDMATDSPAGATDVWTYEVAADSYSTFAKADGTPAGATVTVDQNGVVTVNHAGTATIKVTLQDGAAARTYLDAVAYVTVTVDKAPLVVAPYAAAEDGSPVTSATYGSLDGLASGLLFSYDGGMSWTATAPDWNDGFAGSLAAGEIDAAAQAGTFDVPAVQVPGSFSVDGVAHQGFFSRDYDVSYSTAYHCLPSQRGQAQAGRDPERCMGCIRRCST